MCEEDTEKIEFKISIWTLFPYIMAGIAGIFLLSSYLIDMPMLIWMTFPFIIIGVLADSYYQKRIDEKARKIIKDDE